jgi:xylulokinase
MEKGYLLGVDIGTYESKGVITTLDGKVISTQVAPHALSIPRQGWAEHDPEQVWWGDFCTIVRKLLAESGISPKEILGVGCSAIGPDVLPVDRDCNPLRMAILYGVDTRATAEIAELEQHYGKETIFQKTGNSLSSQAVGPKILWLKHNEPEVYRKAYKFVTASTFLAARLTGNYFIDHLTASFWVPLYDFATQTWNEEMCAGIVELERMADLGWTPEVAGKITRQAALQTGLAEGTPVIIGTADAASEAVSVGVVRPGQLMLMYGSTIFMFLVLDRPAMDERLWAAHYLFPGTSSLAAGMATSGALTRWFRDKLAPDLVAFEETSGQNAYSVLAKQAECIPPGSEGLIVLPYFSGERTPINDPRARGVFFGMTLAHSRDHLFRATLEGMGYGVRHHFDVMRSIDSEPKEVVAVGGGTKNALWLQVVSDITKMSQKVPAVTLGASYGDAFLAGMGVGVFSSYEDINQWMRDIRIVEPNPANFELYDKYQELYLELYQCNKNLMHAVHALA